MSKICLEKSVFRRFCNDFTAKSEKNLILAIPFITRDLTPNFIKLKNCIQSVYDSSSILKNCMIMCGKLISYECNSENLDTTVDLCKFHKYEQISMTQRSLVHV